jgi:hypothetical protein
LFWDATNDRLGIGTNGPAAGLEIVTDSGTTNALRVVSNRAFNLNTDVAINFRYKYDSTNFTTGGLIVAAKDNNTSGSQSGNLQFYTNNAGSVGEQMRIFSDGNIFIGSSPSNAGFKLDVNGTGRFSGNLSVGSGSGAVNLAINRGATGDGNGLRFQTAGTNNWYIGSAATSTNTDLEIYNHNTATTNLRLSYSTGAATFSSSVTTPFITVSNSDGLIGNFNSSNANGGYITWQTSGTTIADIGTAQQIFGTGGNDIFGINGRGARAIAFGTNNTERMRITSNGTIGFNGNSSIGNAGLDKMSMGFLNSNYGWIQTWSGTPLVLQGVGNNVLIGTTTDIGYKLQVEGSLRFSTGQTGGYVRRDSGFVNETANITENATAYFLYKYTGTSNGSSTTFFNITGLSNNNGTWGDIHLTVKKDATASAINTVAYIQINGTDMIGPVFASGTAAVQTIRTIRVVRMDGNWTIIGPVGSY